MINGTISVSVGLKSGTENRGMYMYVYKYIGYIGINIDTGNGKRNGRLSKQYHFSRRYTQPI